MTERQTQALETGGGLQPGPAKLLGSYPQKQEGLFMQRIPVFAGRIDWPRWRRIALIAQRYTPGTPLHVTTRQNVELHHVRGEDVPRVLEELGLAGIHTFGAGGDSIRTITVNPAWETDPHGIDVVPLAVLAREHLLTQTPVLSLPRKFKISFSGSWNHHSQPYLNDLGFTALRPGLFEAVGAGSLGARPEPGILLYPNLAAEEVIPLCHAAVELFAELGDRENRRKARLRHVRQKLGDEEFKAQLDRRFEKAKLQLPMPKLVLAGTRLGFRRLHVLSLPAGNLYAEAALSLADAAQERGAVLRLNLAHGLELYGPQDVELPEVLRRFVNRPQVTACPGAESCPRALVHTKAMAERIYDLPGDVWSGRTVAISGCPNDCARSAAADIGLSGRRQEINGCSTECFAVFAGGGNGASRKLGRLVRIMAAGELLPNPGELNSVVSGDAAS